GGGRLSRPAAGGAGRRRAGRLRLRDRLAVPGRRHRAWRRRPRLAGLPARRPDQGRPQLRRHSGGAPGLPAHPPVVLYPPVVLSAAKDLAPSELGPPRSFTSFRTTAWGKDDGVARTTTRVATPPPGSAAASRPAR